MKHHGPNSEESEGGPAIPKCIRAKLAPFARPNAMLLINSGNTEKAWTEELEDDTADAVPAVTWSPAAGEPILAGLVAYKVEDRFSEKGKSPYETVLK